MPAKPLRLPDDAMVALELRKMHDHLLRPMGVIRAPASLSEAVTAYRSVRGTCERRLGSCAPRNAENAVLPVLHGEPADGRPTSGR